MFASFLFTISALLTVISALFVVITKNIMHSCIYLLGTLLGVAGLYFSLGADFVGVAQIMVYVGGVVILMLFAVMLTGGKDFMQSQSLATLKKLPFMGNKKTYVFGILSASLVALISIQIISKIVSTVKVNGESSYESTVEKIGHLLVTDHLLAFEFSSVLLLGALIGAAIISRPTGRS